MELLRYQAGSSNEQKVTGDLWQELIFWNKPDFSSGVKQVHIGTGI